MARAFFAARLGIFYGAVFLFIGMFMPYFPLWLKAVGLSDTQVALVLAAPFVIRVVMTPLISALADALGNWRNVLVILCWLSLGLLVIWAAAGRGGVSFTGMLLLSSLFGVVWTSVMPLSETVTMRAVRKAGISYGRARLWGSAAFILSSMGLGKALDAFGTGIIMPSLILALFLTVLAAHGLPPDALLDNREEKAGRKVRKGRRRGRREHTFGIPEAGPQQRTGQGARLGVGTGKASADIIAALLRCPEFVLFLVFAGLLQATHGLYYSFGTLHWQSLGYSGATIGVLWGIGVLAEIILFWFAVPVMARWRAVDLLLAGALATVIRWGSMAMGPPLLLLFPLQILHAFTFGAAHLGSMYFISRHLSRKHAGTGQGLYASLAMGIIMGASTLASGELYALWGGRAYLVMAGLGLVSLGGIVVLAFRTRHWRE